LKFNSNQQISDEKILNSTISDHSDFNPELNGELFGFQSTRQNDDQSGLSSFQIINVTSILSEQAFKVTVQIMHFTLDITILESLENSENFNKSTDFDSSGANSTIYFFRRISSSQKKNFVLKSVNYATDNFNAIFINTLKEVAISKIASVMQIGPSFETIFGFDIIVHRQSI
jgi:hypothetical protein